MIPMLVGSRFRRQTKIARRLKVWVGSQSSRFQMANSVIAVQTIIDEASLEIQGKPTVARIRGTWNAWHDHSAAAATSSMMVACGITLVSTKSATVGSTALSSPLTNIEWPWLWWDATVVGTEVVTAVGVESATCSNRMIDSKAMRKVPPAHTMVFVIETGPALEGAPDANIAFALRILLMPS